MRKHTLLEISSSLPFSGPRVFSVTRAPSRVFAARLKINIVFTPAAPLRTVNGCTFVIVRSRTPVVKSDDFARTVRENVFERKYRTFPWSVWCCYFRACSKVGRDDAISCRFQLGSSMRCRFWRNVSEKYQRIDGTRCAFRGLV